MPLFDGLNLFEIVMLVLGALFFVVLAIVVATLALKNGAYGKLLPFFVIPIIMMAWPGIRSVEFNNDVVTIQTNVASLEQDPADSGARASLQKVLPDVANRPSTNPTTLTLVARAALALGDSSIASAKIEEALRVDPKLPAATDLKNRIEAEASLPALTRQAEDRPADAATTAELQRNIATITRAPVLNPATLANVASGQAALGDRTAALITADRALRISPALPQAVQLRARIQAR